MSSTSSGIAMLLVAGMANGSFTIPMKFTRKWAWENTWLAWTIFALVLLPFAAAALTVPNLSTVYRSVTPEIIFEVCGFGAAWGVAQVLFGLAVDMIGITLTFSIVLGTSAALGSLIPMVSLHRGQLNSPAGYAVLGAIAFVLLGVILCAAAGSMRDGSGAPSTSSPKRTSQGLLVSILSGLAASTMNFGIAFGTPLVQAARSFGANALNAVNAVWLPLLVAGAIPNLLYCAWLIRRNRSGPRYRAGHSHWALAALMAILWCGGTLLYGRAATELGTWGPILGWPLFMSLIVITATTLGMLAGEWKDSGPRPVRIQWAGVTVLVVAIFILADSSRYLR
jgi:L-rhamnose-H+ transport protein